MSKDSFTPVTTTAARAVTAASQAIPALTFLSTLSQAQKDVYGAMDTRLTNIGTVPVFVAYADPGAAAPTAAIPADGTVSLVLTVIVEPNTTKTIQAPFGVQLAAIASGAGSSLYVTQGRGLNL